jgi:uncharacterized protein (DUF433 family)
MTIEPVRHARLVDGRRPRGDERQVAIDLHRIGVDHDAAELLRQGQRQRRLAAGGGACNQSDVRLRHGVTTLVAADRTGEYFTAMKQSVVSRNSEVMGGAPVFRGTRVPVATLLDYLEAGDSIDDFLAGFPSVTRTQVIAFLEEAKDRLIDSVS